MRDALAARNIGQVYRLLQRRGVGQRQIAALTGQSITDVSAIIRGQRRVVAYQLIARIADGLSIPRDYVGLAYDDNTASRLVTAAVEDPQLEVDDTCEIDVFWRTPQPSSRGQFDSDRPRRWVPEQQF